MAQGGSNSYFIFGEHTVSAWGVPIHADDYVEIIYEVVSSGLKSVGDLILPERFKGNASPTPGIQNFEHCEGDIPMHLHGEDLLVFFKHLFQAGAAEIDSNDSVAQELRANGVFTDPMSITTQPSATPTPCNPCKLVFTWSVERAHTVQTVRTNGVFTNPMSLTAQPSTPSQLIFTWSEIRAHDGGIAKDMDLSGTDAVGDPQTETISVAEGATTVTSVKTWASIDTLGISFAVGFDVTDSLKIESNTTKTMTITGTDQNDIAMEEIISVPFDTLTVSSTRYFKTVDASGIDFEAGFDLTGNLLVEGDKNTWTHVIILGEELGDGLQFEIVKGGIPSVYTGCLINTGVIDVGDVLTFTMGLIGKQGWNRYKTGATTGNPVKSNTPTDVALYDRVSQEVDPAWSLAMSLDDIAIPLASMTITIDNQLAIPTRYTGERFIVKPRRSANRVITINPGVDYDTINPDWDMKFEDMISMVGIVSAFRRPFAGPELSIQVDCPNLQMANPPDPDVSNYMEILSSLTLRALRSVGATTSDEIKVTIVCEKDFP